MVRSTKLLLAAVTVLALAAGCGGTAKGPVADPTTPTATPTATDSPSSSPTVSPVVLPTCARTWIAGRTLPAAYQGCRVGTSRYVARTHCESGQELFVYAGHFYAVPGARIFRAAGALKDDARFQRIRRACGA